MSDRRIQNPAGRADRFVLILYLILLTAGWFSVCGASHEIGDTMFFDTATRSGKQLMWICCAMGIGTFLLMIDDRYFESWAAPLYIITLVILLATPFLARDIKGSRSWISLGSVNLQPAEMAKSVVALALAKLIGTYGFDMTKTRDFLRAAAMVLVPVLLIILQKETGSALVFCAFFLMFYREGMPGAFLFTAVAAVSYFVIGIGYDHVIVPGTLTAMGEWIVLILIWIFTAGMVAVYADSRPAWHIFWTGCIVTPLLWLVSRFIVPTHFDISWGLMVFIVGAVIYLLWQSLATRCKSYFYIALFAIGSMTFLYSAEFALNNVLEPHQRTRINILLGKEYDPAGAGYNVRQSKIAIGSGGLMGKGFMNGTQTKLKYVPEQDTDFIFCTVGEEQGFIGSSAVLLLFLLLILRLIYLAERQKTDFNRVYGYCVISILLFHLFINVGMVMGLTPVIGIPLPFFSYGGSSLWGFTILLFIFLRLDSADQIKMR